MCRLSQQSNSSENLSPFRSGIFYFGCYCGENSCFEGFWSKKYLYSLVPATRLKLCLQLETALSKKLIATTGKIIQSFWSVFANMSASVSYFMVLVYIGKYLIPLPKAATRKKHHTKANFSPITWILLISRLSRKSKDILKHTQVTKLPQIKNRPETECKSHEGLPGTDAALVLTQLREEDSYWFQYIQFWCRLLRSTEM